MSFPTLGHDPAPGDPHAVRALAARLGGAAEDAETITGRLRKMGSGSGDLIWRGPAAESFHTLLAQVGPDVIRLANAHREAQDALVYYAGELERAQDVARRAESDAAGATSDRDQAAGRRRQAGDEAAAQDRQVWECRRQIATSQATRLVWAADPAYQAQLLQYENRTRTIQHRAETGAALARGREQAARSDESTAAARLKAAQLLGGQARDVRDAAARRTVDRLDAAGRPAHANRGLVQRLLTGLDDLGRHVVTSEGFATFMGILGGASDVLTGISVGALLIAGIFPPAAVVAVPIATIAGVLSTSVGLLLLGGTIAGRRYGTRSTGDVLMAALEVVPGLRTLRKVGGQLVTRVVPRAGHVVERVGKAVDRFEDRVARTAPGRAVVRFTDEVNKRVAPLKHFSAPDLVDLGRLGWDAGRTVAPLVKPLPWLGPPAHLSPGGTP